MRQVLLMAAALLAAAPAFAQPADPHAGHDMSTMGAPASDPPVAGPPPEALGGPAHAADTVFDGGEMRAAREVLRQSVGDVIAYKAIAERLEARIREGDEGYLWDVQAWVGGDIDKFWLESEGEGAFGSKAESIETRLLWSHAVAPFYDVRAGVRYDIRPEPDRGYLALGLQGLAPYMIEFDANLYLSEKADLSFRIEAESDLLLTQRLVLQPRIEAHLSAQDTPEHGVGAGLSDFEAGLRLRYEVVREFAPYVGVEYVRKIGRTADFARDEGEDVDELALLIGLRAWF